MARKTVGFLTVIVGLVSMTTLLSAHHSRAMYDVEQLVSVEGVVTNVEWRNPHMWITLDVPGTSGKLESWGFEGSGAASMVASGISPHSRSAIGSRSLRIPRGTSRSAPPSSWAWK